MKLLAIVVLLVTSTTFSLGQTEQTPNNAFCSWIASHLPSECSLYSDCLGIGCSVDLWHVDTIGFGAGLRLCGNPIVADVHVNESRLGLHWSCGISGSANIPVPGLSVEVPDFGTVGVALVASVGTQGSNVVIDLGLTGCVGAQPEGERDLIEMEQIGAALRGSSSGSSSSPSSSSASVENPESMGGCLQTRDGSQEEWGRRVQSLGWYGESQAQSLSRGRDGAAAREERAPASVGQSESRLDNGTAGEGSPNKCLPTLHVLQLDIPASVLPCSL